VFPKNLRVISSYKKKIIKKVLLHHVTQIYYVINHKVAAVQYDQKKSHMAVLLNDDGLKRKSSLCSKIMTCRLLHRCLPRMFISIMKLHNNFVCTMYHTLFYHMAHIIVRCRGTKKNSLSIYVYTVILLQNWRRFYYAEAKLGHYDIYM
jgi:hypothetical protein